MNYNLFAKVYDEVMDQSLYEDWLSFTKSSIQQHVHIPISQIMELACGTGEMAMRLSREGIDVIAVDLSENMLAIAQQKALEENLDITFVAADMRNLEDMPQVQVVTLYSDSLCYLTDFEDVSLVFEQVYQCLEEGGCFLFDVHSTYQMNEVFPGYQYSYTTDESAFIWQSFALEEDCVEHVIDIFVRNKDGKYERFEETHVEKTFSIEDYCASLKRAGFKRVIVKADFGKSEVTSTTARWFFICKK